jgi:hypothetical protein
MKNRQFRVLYREFLFRIVDLELLAQQGDITKLLAQFAVPQSAAFPVRGLVDEQGYQCEADPERQMEVGLAGQVGARERDLLRAAQAEFCDDDSEQAEYNLIPPAPAAPPGTSGRPLG